MTHSKTRALIGSAGAFVLSGVLWGTVLALFGFYPFGEKSILITDMSSQYVEYFAAFTRMVREGDSLLFTWDTAVSYTHLEQRFQVFRRCITSAGTDPRPIFPYPRAPAPILRAGRPVVSASDPARP